ncbi:hypothetical protein L596_002822 [Steinernema carpocapsae]|uniref:Uncharacterized protein n=1 Tax=Steinernema carpocapsae TaxID=34508 RepID=A0A4U8UQT4_STECR|nr:hypothetical protein L596_002822 [Steinernema carpocapsae]
MSGQDQTGNVSKVRSVLSATVDPPTEARICQYVDTASQLCLGSPVQKPRVTTALRRKRKQSRDRLLRITQSTGVFANTDLFLNVKSIF